MAKKEGEEGAGVEGEEEEEEDDDEEGLEGKEVVEGAPVVKDGKVEALKE